MISFIADVLILGALGFVGWGQVSKSRGLAAMKQANEGVQDALRAVEAVKKEIILLAAVARNEGDKLRQAAVEAASATEAAVAQRKALSFETARAGALVGEVESAAASADRACTRLSEAVSRAAAAHGGIEETGEMDEGDREVMSSGRSRRRAKSVVRLVKG